MTERLGQLRPSAWMYRVPGLTALTRRLRASDSLFGRIRWRLTLWYSGVLAAALVLCGLVLYLSVQQSLLGPINSSLVQDTHILAASWQHGPGGGPSAFGCPAHDPRVDDSALVACYSPNGQLVARSDFAAAGNYRSFWQTSALTGSGHRSAMDTVTNPEHGEIAASRDFSAIRRYALRVPNLFGTGQLGIIQFGLPIGAQLTTLDQLLHLLLILGAATLLLSFGAGLFLANRALLPARIAYARQRDFVADASHELRTPLTMMRSSLEYILRNKSHLSTSDVALLEDSVEETEHLASLAANMLTLARLDSDAVRMDEEVVDVSRLTSQVARWAESLGRDAGITMIQSIRPGVLVLGDKPLLEQALLVLVDNAIKYNRDGGRVTVSVDVDQNLARIEVSDTGIGIAKEHLDKLGERFYRVDKARSRESGGAGLGLSIVRSIVAKHEGTVHIASVPDQGTRVAVTLPLLGVEAGGDHPSEVSTTEPVPPSALRTQESLS